MLFPHWRATSLAHFLLSNQFGGTVNRFSRLSPSHHIHPITSMTYSLMTACRSGSEDRLKKVLLSSRSIDQILPHPVIGREKETVEPCPSAN
jgi:hypothetical protein